MISSWLSVKRNLVVMVSPMTAQTVKDLSLYEKFPSINLSIVFQRDSGDGMTTHTMKNVGAGMLYIKAPTVSKLKAKAIMDHVVTPK